MTGQPSGSIFIPVVLLFPRYVSFRDWGEFGRSDFKVHVGRDDGEGDAEDHGVKVEPILGHLEVPTTWDNVHLGRTVTSEANLKKMEGNVVKTNRVISDLLIL